MTSLALRVDAQGGVLLKVAARPGASRSAVQGVAGDALKVAVQAPPEKGKANDELVRFLARALGLRRAQVTLVRGEASRDKVVRVEGLEVEALRERLAGLVGA
ncbi:MAG: DUF167 domain-containing protein [Planctomycetes bacterium]|nr:DUF167 domain-containing protein [Planctomycetota bacterium]